MNKYYITTAIPYVNANPHIGFALELVQTDVVARFHRQRGDEVFFLTGADENSLKNVQAAEIAGITTQKLVNQNTQKFIDLTRALNISNNDFIRTTSTKHFAGAQKLWQACRPEDIYKKSYKGYYCVGCEAFVTEKDLVGGKCPEHNTAPELVEEKNYFFKLSNYQKKLARLIKSDKYKIAPESRKNEVLSFIEMGLEDFSASRSKARAKNWGVPVPGDPEQVMYVWFDALSNYITALGYDSPAERDEKFKKFWPADAHVVGKGIIRFHAIYWPAMLLSAGLPLPKELFVHGYINIAGEKMSKSLGNVIDPFALVEKYGVEPVRYYLLRYIHPVQDSDFDIKKFEEAYNSDLANGLGNLVSRVTGLIEQNEIEIKSKVKSSASAKATADRRQSKVFEKFISNYQFDQALKYIWEKIAGLDSYISKEEPWALAKAGKKEKLEKVLGKAAQGILEVAVLLEPFLPETSRKVREILTAKEIKKAAPMFPRLEK